MPTPKKPTTARASAFSTTNRAAAFNPPKAAPPAARRTTAAPPARRPVAEPAAAKVARASAFGTTNRAAAFDPQKAAFNNTAPRTGPSRTVPASTSMGDGAGRSAEFGWDFWRKKRAEQDAKKAGYPSAAAKKAAEAAAAKKAAADKKAADLAQKKKEQAAMAAEEAARLKNGATPTAPRTAPKATGYTWTPPAGVNPSNSHNMTVKKGDTLWALAKRAPGGNSNKEVQARLDAILAKNPQYKKNPNLIKPSDVVTW